MFSKEKPERFLLRTSTSLGRIAFWAVRAIHCKAPAITPYHRWWFFPDLHADEALLLKLHDTDHTVAWRVPHTAFETPYAADANPRESVEFRTIAFFC